jgi:hypothetical protein
VLITRRELLAGLAAVPVISALTGLGFAQSDVSELRIDASRPQQSLEGLSKTWKEKALELENQAEKEAGSKREHLLALAQLLYGCAEDLRKGRVRFCEGHRCWPEPKCTQPASVLRLHLSRVPKTAF